MNTTSTKTATKAKEMHLGEKNHYHCLLYGTVYPNSLVPLTGPSSLKRNTRGSETYCAVCTWLPEDAGVLFHFFLQTHKY